MLIENILEVRDVTAHCGVTVTSLWRHCGVTVASM
jgi:hypothetical protein